MSMVKCVCVPVPFIAVPSTETMCTLIGKVVLFFTKHTDKLFEFSATVILGTSKPTVITKFYRERFLMKNIIACIFFTFIVCYKNPSK